VSQNAAEERAPILRKSPGEEQFRVFIETVRDYALLILDTEGHIATWNAGAEAIKGWKGPEIIGQHFSRFYPPEAIAAGLPTRELEGAIREGRYEDEGWRVRKDGTRFWANVVITALRDSDGRHIGFAKVTRDLTERRRHEEILRQSEARFRTLIEGVRDYAIFMLDPDGHVTTWNAGAQQILGYDSREILGRHLADFYPPGSSRGSLAEREIQAATLEGHYEDEGWRVKKDGTRFWANAVLTAIRDSSGQLQGFSKIIRDLTERREYETHLRESQERFRLLVESVIDYAIVAIDAEGFINSWNHGAQRITGFSATEIVGRHFSRLYPPEDIGDHKPWRQMIAAREQGRVSEEGWRLRKDGTQFWANSVIGRLPGVEGGRETFYIVTQDLTQRRHAESLADTAQKMHEFIAMLAHELRNPLAPIRNAVMLMERRKIDDPMVESMRQTIERQSAHLVRIIDELLDVNRVARGQFTVEKTTIDLRDVIQRAVETSRPLIDARQHRFTLELPGHPVCVEADAMRMTQVIVNLLNNAAKYTPAGGEIHLEAGLSGQSAEIRVRDNGKGIERAALDRIFDLFIQLEPNAGGALGGLGVGLALVRRIVELHGGRVQAKSEGPGRGSEFIVRIPLSRATVTPVEPVPDTPGSLEPLRILVVDDNVDAADSLALLLQQSNHQVRTVYDGPAALREVQADNPDLVLLDIGMPHMSGYEVARAITTMTLPSPPMIVAISGWGQPADKVRAREAGFHRHFSKPVGESDIHALLAEVVERRVAGQRAG
jgi:PAS domain S-box-containing protein